MIKKSILFFAVILLFFVESRAQFPQYSQYTFNKFLLNPAVAGTSGFTNISLIAHEQWVGFGGTPKTHSITVDSKIFPDSYISKTVQIKKKKRKSSKSGRVGVGGHLYNDHTELLDRTGIEGAYSYHINLEKTILSMGFSVNFFQFRLNKDRVIFSDNKSDVLVDGKKNIYIPDANVGIYAVSEFYYAGLSAMSVLNSSLQFGDNNLGENRVKRQYNLMGGYRYVINDDFIAEPSLLVKIPHGNKAQLDIQAKMTIKKDYWAGLAFRTGSAVCVFGGLKVDRYYFGYAFDYNFNKLGASTYGSHEIVAAVKFGDNARRYRWLNEY